MCLSPRFGSLQPNRFRNNDWPVWCLPLPSAGSAGASSASTPAPRWLQTTGKHSAGFTSTTLDPVTSNEIAALSAEEAARQRYAFLKTKKQKAYAQLQTTHGNLNLEIHVDVRGPTPHMHGWHFCTLGVRHMVVRLR
eukprot:6199649-Pleurochrysis_carterae.AAC.1